MPDPTGRISHADQFHRGMSWKTYCRVATTANVTIATALNAGDSIDGVTLAAGDRVLVKDQSTGSQNGIYIAGATPARAWDMDQDLTYSVPAEEVLGAVVLVIAGTANGGKLYRCTNTTSPVIGTTALVFAEVGGSSIADILDLPTAETDDTLVLAPDGIGGVEFRAETGGGGGGSFTHAYVGYNTAGGSTETMANTKVYAKKITVAAGLLGAISCYVDNGAADNGVGSIAWALFNDNAGTPEYIIGSGSGKIDSLFMDNVVGGGGHQNPRWYHMGCGPIYLAAGDYWIAVSCMDNDAPFRIYYDGSGSDRTYTVTAAWFADWGAYSPTTTSNKYSIRASFIT